MFEKTLTGTQDEHSSTHGTVLTLLPFPFFIYL